MAQAAWSGPALRLSSWSCIGPRRRATNIYSEGSPESPSLREDPSDTLISSSYNSPTTSRDETVELPESTNSSAEWTSEIEYPCSQEIDPHPDDGNNLNHIDSHIEHTMGEDDINQVELWHQLEDELYSRPQEENHDLEKEIREEEAAAIAEVSESEPGTSGPEKNEAHRFFPPGKIMHIIEFQMENEMHHNGDNPSSSDSDSNQPPPEPKIGIFHTPRSLYSKIRLSQTMISDHFMPVYRRRLRN